MEGRKSWLQVLSDAWVSSGHFYFCSSNGRGLHRKLSRRGKPSRPRRSQYFGFCWVDCQNASLFKATLKQQNRVAPDPLKRITIHCIARLFWVDACLHSSATSLSQKSLPFSLCCCQSACVTSPTPLFPLPPPQLNLLNQLIPPPEILLGGKHARLRMNCTGVFP